MMLRSTPWAALVLSVLLAGLLVGCGGGGDETTTAPATGGAPGMGMGGPGSPQMPAMGGPGTPATGGPATPSTGGPAMASGFGSPMPGGGASPMGAPGAPGASAGATGAQPGQQIAAAQGPPPPSRPDPFKPWWDAKATPPPPPPATFVTPVRLAIRESGITPPERGTEVQEVPTRRVAGILTGAGIYALIEGADLPSGQIVVRPGDMVGEYRVASINARSVTLKRTVRGVTYTQVIPLTDVGSMQRSTGFPGGMRGPGGPGVPGMPGMPGTGGPMGGGRMPGGGAAPGMEMD